jgi:hypothetical protein
VKVALVNAQKQTEGRTQRIERTRFDISIYVPKNQSENKEVVQFNASLLFLFLVTFRILRLRNVRLSVIFCKYEVFKKYKTKNV